MAEMPPLPALAGSARPTAGRGHKTTLPDSVLRKKTPKT